MAKVNTGVQLTFDDALMSEVNELVQVPTVYMTKAGNVPYEYSPNTCQNKMKKSRPHAPMSLHMMQFLMLNGADVSVVEQFSSGCFMHFINLQRMYSAGNA